MTGLDSGQVTVADLYKVMTGIQTDLREAVSKLEVIDARNVMADKIQSDHEARLRSLEAFKLKSTGIAVFLATAAGIASGYLTAVHHP